MKEKFYQACYTRVGVHEGWKTVNVSPDIPLHLLSFFEKTEAGNEVKRGTPLDENGNALWMLEIMSERGGIGISRIQYGLSDAFGRSNIFCHGYLFPNGYEMLKNPNQLLCIQDKNFKRSMEETQEIPKELSMEAELDAEGAMKLCNMTAEGYIRYIHCIYYALSTNTKNTIYVCTDGSDDMAKALLYLTYIAIPYSLRLKITASTCPEIEGANKMLVFSRKIPEHTRYVNPQTGENNIMTSAIEMRWKRNPFVSYFAENYQRPEQNEHIFQKIEKWLGEMGDISLNDMDSLRLAYSMCYLTEKLKEDDELSGLLYDWLALPVSNSEKMERVIVCFLNEIVARQIRLGHETEELLKERADTAVTREMRDVYFSYFSSILTKMERKEGCQYLRKLGKENPVFAYFRGNLMSTEQGKELLCDYYMENIDILSADTECLYSDLVEAYYDCIDLPCILPVIRERLHRKNLDISKKKLREGSGFDEISHLYCDTEADLQNAGEFPRELPDEYNRLVTSDFRIEKITEYDEFYSKYPDYQLMQKFLKSLHALEKHKYEWVAKFLNSGFSDDLSHDKTELLFQYAIDHGAAKSCVSPIFWEIIADRKKVSLERLLIENNVSVLYDADLLEKSLKNDLDFWRTTEFIESFYKRCLLYLEQHAEYKNILADSCEVLRNEIRQRKSEDKRKQKELNKKDRKDNKLFGILNSFKKIDIKEDEEADRVIQDEKEKPDKKWTFKGRNK